MGKITNIVLVYLILGVLYLALLYFEILPGGNILSTILGIVFLPFNYLYSIIRGPLPIT